MRRFLASLLFFALFFVVFPSLSARASRDETNLDETVLSCEEAVAKLQRCCSDFDPTRIGCVDERFDDTGCGVHSYGRTLPAYTMAESVCIRETSCEALEASGVCKRAAEVTRRGRVTTEDLDGTSPSTTKNYDRQPMVCP